MKRPEPKEGWSSDALCYGQEEMDTYVNLLEKALKDIKKSVVENYGWKPVREGDGCAEEIKIILKGVGL